MGPDDSQASRGSTKGQNKRVNSTSMSENQNRAVKGIVLVVDDERTIRDSLRMILEYEGYRVEEASCGSEAMVAVANVNPEAVILDIKMPEMDGMEVLNSLKERGFTMPILMISGHADINTAVKATRRGAFDFFEKPLKKERVLTSLRNAVESYRLRQDPEVNRFSVDELIGESSAMRQLHETIERAAPTTATVLVTGESGTGKELVARAIHHGSSRRSGVMVQVNCAAIPDELIESELFGHERGSFTGAVRKQTGKFVAANGGTIFLDEVGDMSARTQAKVLRVLQNGLVEPVGAAKTVSVDVRVVAATNRNLEEEIKEGRFREDLYYRLNVIPISTPALKDRLDDIPLLVDYFIRRYADTQNYRRKEISGDALDALKAMPWKGNVRELKNLIERLLILTSGDIIGRDDVYRVSGGRKTDEVPAAIQSARTLREFREQSERYFLMRKLSEFDWNVTRTAQEIDTPRSNLYKKLEQYKIQREEN